MPRVMQSVACRGERYLRSFLGCFALTHESGNHDSDGFQLCRICTHGKLEKTAAACSPHCHVLLPLDFAALKSQLSATGRYHMQYIPGEKPISRNAQWIQKGIDKSTSTTLAPSCFMGSVLAPSQHPKYICVYVHTHRHILNIT